MKKLFILAMFFAFSFISIAQQQEVPYTLADRDRMIQVEAKVDALSARFDQIDKRIDRMEDKFDTYFTWGFGLVLGAIFALFGFIIFDRRTTLAPVKREQDKLLEVLKELGKEDAKIREALKKVALW
jgi:septation ring formation regulator EzrA